MAEEQALIELTADIVAAHVSNNKVAVADIAALVANVHGALVQLGARPTEPEPHSKSPAVAVRNSVKPDHISCLECGSKQKMLKRHLQSAHGLTPEQYRKNYGLLNSYPMVAPNYAQQRAELAKRIGLGSKGRRPKSKPAPAEQPKRRGSPKKV